MIHQIRRSAIVGRSDAQMFALVNDVEAYPRRFKWCVSAQVSDRSDTALTARMELRVGGMTQEFASRVYVQADYVHSRGKDAVLSRNVNVQKVNGAFVTICAQR